VLLVAASVFLGIHAITNPSALIFKDLGQDYLYRLTTVIDDEIAHGIIMAAAIIYTYSLCIMELRRVGDPLPSRWQELFITMVSIVGGALWGYCLYIVRVGWIIVPLTAVFCLYLYQLWQREHITWRDYPWSWYWLLYQSVSLISYGILVGIYSFEEFKLWWGQAI
jgi:hypothetical protein